MSEEMKMDETVTEEAEGQAAAEEKTTLPKRNRRKR